MWLRNNRCVVAVHVAVALVPLFDQARVCADEVVDLKVDSQPRKYDIKNPLQAEKQDFALSKAGVLTLVYVNDPVHSGRRCGYSLDEVNLRNYSIGTGIFLERIPAGKTAT